MKKSISVIIVFLVILTLTSTSFAESSSNESSSPQTSFSTSDIENHSCEGDVQKFTSIDDEGLLPKRAPRAIGSAIWSTTWYAGTGTQVVERAIDKGSSKLSRVFVRYLTGSWTKASSYVWSKSNSATWTIK